MTHGDAAAKMVMRTGSNGRLEIRRYVEDHRHAEEQHRFEHLTDADDDEDRGDDEGGKHLDRKPRQTILEDVGDHRR